MNNISDMETSKALNIFIVVIIWGTHGMSWWPAVLL